MTLVLRARFAASFLLPFALACSASATVRHVPGDYPTIQGAVASAAPGDTVFVHDGIYAGGVTLRSNITVLGESRDGVVVQGTSGGPQWGFDFFDYDGTPRGLNGAVVENLTVRGFQRAVRFADNFTSGGPRPRSLTLRGLLVEDCGEGFYLSWNATPSGALVEGNEIRGGLGVTLTRAQGEVRVTSNRIVGPNIGVRVDTYGGPIVDHNVVVGATSRGVELGGSTTTFTHNTVVGGAIGVFVSFDDAQVSSNILAGNGQAVSVYSGASTFRHNVYWDNAELGRDLDATETVGDPRFVADGSYRLGTGSAGIDAGDPAAPYGAEPAYNGMRADAGAYGNTALATPSTPEAGVSLGVSVPVAGVGAFAGVEVVITNTGTTRLDIRGVRVAVSPDAFAVVGDLPDAVPAGGTAAVRVTLLSQSQGTFADTLVVETNDEDEPAVSFPLEARRVERVYVDPSGAGGDGSSWPVARRDLAGALSFVGAIEGRTSVWVRGGTYRPSGAGRQATFTVREGVSLLGGFSGTETSPDRDPALNPTVLSGDIGVAGEPTDNAYHVITVRAIAAADTAVLDGVVVTGGQGSQPDPSANGGGLVGTGVDLDVRRSTFESNYGVRGGGMYCLACSLTLTDVAFRANQSSFNGGGLYVEGGSVAVSRTSFTGNGSVTGPGGAVFVSSTFTLTDAQFTENRSTSGFGGGLGVERGSGQVSRVTFERNQARGGGGASVWVTPEAPPSRLQDVLFDGNVATSGNGGGLSVIGGGAVRVERARFLANTALSGGGLSAGGPSVIVDVEFEGNTSSSDGGAAYLSGGVPVMVGARFVRNRSNYGGALSVDGSNPRVFESEFLGNSANLGGAVLVRGAAEATIANSTFVGNSAANGAGYGSALMTLSGASRLVNVTLAANGPRAVSAQGSSVPRVENAVAWPVASPFFEGFGGGTGASVVVDHAVVQGGAAGTAVIDADPLYVRAPAPGVDGVWGTPDDDYGDLRVQGGSPAVDAGLASLLPADTGDLDDDGDTSEPVPTALGGDPRVRGGTVDLGAYESAGGVSTEGEAPVQSGLLVTGPNPTRSRTALALYTDVPAERAVVALYDVLGRRVATLHQGPIGIGLVDIVVNVSDLAVGAYVVRAEVGTDLWTARLTVVK